MAHRSGQNRQQFGLFVTPLDEIIAHSSRFSYTLLKGNEKVSAEYSLVFLAYPECSGRRAVSILGAKGLMERVKSLFFRFFVPWRTVARGGGNFFSCESALLWRRVTREGRRAAA